MKSIASLSILSAATAVGFSLLSNAAAAVFAINPVADAFVTPGPTGNLTNNNYGGAGSLALSAAASPNGEFQSLIRFNLASTVINFDNKFGAGQWMIEAVTLQLTSAAPVNPLFNVNAAGSFSVTWIQNDSWLEGTGTPGAPGATGITFTELPNLTTTGDVVLGSFPISAANSGANNFILPMAENFKADLNAGGNVDFRLAAATSNVSYLFNSRSFGVVANRPLLSVTASAIPEPDAAVLISCGTLLLTGWRRRNEKPA